MHKIRPQRRSKYSMLTWCSLLRTVTGRAAARSGSGSGGDSGDGGLLGDGSPVESDSPDLRRKTYGFHITIEPFDIFVWWVGGLVKILASFARCDSPKRLDQIEVKSKKVAERMQRHIAAIDSTAIVLNVQLNQ